MSRKEMTGEKKERIDFNFINWFDMKFIFSRLICFQAPFLFSPLNFILLGI